MTNNKPIRRFGLSERTERRLWMLLPWVLIFCGGAVSTLAPDPVVHRVAAVEDLETLLPRPRDGDQVVTLGYYEAGDGGGNTFVYRSTGRPTADGGFYIDGPGGPGADDYYEALNKRSPSVLQFGAKADGTDGATTTTAFQNAINAARDYLGKFTHSSTLINASTGFGEIVRVPAGKYLITDTLLCPGGLIIAGDGPGASIIRFSPASSKDLFSMDPANPSRNTHHWLVEFRDLTIGGDYVDAVSSQFARRGIDLSSGHRSRTVRCAIEAFQVGWYASGSDSYYSVIEDCVFVDNKRHIEQGASTQPLTVRGSTLFMSSAMVNRSVADYPTEAILSTRPLRLDSTSIESSEYYANDDVDQYAKIRSTSGLTINGIYVEDQDTLAEVDWKAANRSLTINGIVGQVGSHRLLKLLNYGANDTAKASSADWMNNITTPFSNWKYVPLVRNPFTVFGDTDHTNLTGCVYQTTTAYNTVGGSYQFTSTTGSGGGLVTLVRHTITEAQLAPYRGQRLYFGALINRNSLYPIFDEPSGLTQRLQVQDSSGAPISYAIAPAIDYGNGWELWVTDYEVPAAVASIDDVFVNFRLTPTSIGDDCFIQGYACWQGGFDHFPIMGQYQRWGPTPSKTAYAAGTAYALTNTAVALDFGTTDPAITITVPGTYRITGRAKLTYNGATVSAETATIKLRRTNNTAGDLTNGSTTIDLPTATTLTHDYGWVDLDVIYTTTNSDDAITLFGNVSAALGAGTIDTSSAHIIAERID